MTGSSHVRLMASYNAWMNDRLLDAAGSLPHESLSADRHAFFGSILGTLNHLVVGDIIWLKRFATHPANYEALAPVRELATPSSLDQALFADLQALAAQRRTLDGIISRWSEAVTDEELDHVLRYANVEGVVSHRRFFSLMMHFFNHQTHHRGQLTALLSQAGVDVGVTDLLVLIPEQAQA